MTTTCNAESREDRRASATAGIAKLRDTSAADQLIAYGFLLGLGAQLPQQQATEQ